ncbi:MAG: hypothetical protein JXA68_08720 [Ignavibacteriales bacterium]|nr:hypothetical protein [Ignavibacteriales bacterium]
MKHKRFLVLTISFLIFLSTGYGQLDDYYNKVKESPDIVIKVLNDSIELINVYKHQIKLIHENRNLPLTTQQDSFANVMYHDYPMLWSSFFGKSKYKEFLYEDWGILNNPNVVGIWLPFSFNIEATIEEIGNKYSKLTGYTPQCKFFLFYGTGRGIGDIWALMKNLCGPTSQLLEKKKGLFLICHMSLIICCLIKLIKVK